MRLRTLSGQILAPLAGQGVTFQFSQNERVKLESATLTLTTDATVATRYLYGAILDATGMAVFYTGDATGMAASGQQAFTFSPAFGAAAPGRAGNNYSIGLALPNMWLPPGWQFRV